MLYLAVFPTLLATFCWNHAIGAIGANRAAIFINLIPVFVAFFSFFILGDEITIQKMMGIAIVITGLFLAQLKRRKRKDGSYPVLQT